MESAELIAILREARSRVRAGNPDTAAGAADIPLPDLMPLVHARDAALGKVAAIGSVNPRRGGPANTLVQAWKRTIARVLDWHVREQVEFNRKTMACVDAAIEALTDANRALVEFGNRLAGAETRSYAFPEFADRLADLEKRADLLNLELDKRTAALSSAIDTRTDQVASEAEKRAAELSSSIGAAHAQLRHEFHLTAKNFEQLDLAHHQLTGEFDDIRKHWSEWRIGWERKLETNEIQFLRSVADLQGAFQHRTNLMDANYRDAIRSQHADFTAALERTGSDIQKRLWADLERIRLEYEALIHSELRIVRQRAQILAPPSPAAPAPAGTAASAALPFDYARFAERFRGSEDYVKASHQFYLPYFKDCRNVLDIGCGRGEFLELMRASGVPARGIDLSEESIALCRHKGLDAQSADLFEFLPSLPGPPLDGIFCSQVVEHLPPERLPETIRLMASVLSRGGVLAIETPNPECLAIFASHFYLDPTHTRPVPAPLLVFYLEEFGIGGIEVHRLAPAVESMPALAELPGDFREAFFGGLDYAVIGHKL